MGQLWFIGFLSKILATPLLEQYGHFRVLKTVLIPLNLLSFQLQYMSKSYALRCIGFYLAGFTKLKMVPLLALLKESVQIRHSGKATTFMYFFCFTIVAMFCFFLHFI
jgi:hypothetical protein